MTLAFDELKATQAAAAFLRHAGSPLNYMGLIKLLYKADREAIRRWGLPITTDKYAAMKNGPVTSHIYDRIKASANPNAHGTIWSTHIQKDTDPLQVRIISDPGDSELSPAEESLIAEIFTSDGAKDRFELVRDSHEEYPEWKNPGNSSTPIDISEIIEALELSDDECKKVACLIEGQRAAFSLAL